VTYVYRAAGGDTRVRDFERVRERRHHCTACHAGVICVCARVPVALQQQQQPPPPPPPSQQQQQQQQQQSFKDKRAASAAQETGAQRWSRQPSPSKPCIAFKAPLITRLQGTPDHTEASRARARNEPSGFGFFKACIAFKAPCVFPGAGAKRAVQRGEETPDPRPETRGRGDSRPETPDLPAMSLAHAVRVKGAQQGGGVRVSGFKVWGLGFGV